MLEYKIYFTRIDGAISEELMELVKGFVSLRRKSSIRSIHENPNLANETAQGVVRKDSLGVPYLYVCKDSEYHAGITFDELTRRLRLLSSENIIIELNDEYDNTIKTCEIYNESKKEDSTCCRIM